MTFEDEKERLKRSGLIGGGAVISPEGYQRSTAGIAPAHGGALNTLQFATTTDHDPELYARSKITQAAREVSKYHPPTGDQEYRHQIAAKALEDFLVTIVTVCKPGPERSTAISRAREAKMWASAAIALEGL